MFVFAGRDSENRKQVFQLCDSHDIAVEERCCRTTCLQRLRTLLQTAPGSAHDTLLSKVHLLKLQNTA